MKHLRKDSSLWIRERRYRNSIAKIIDEAKIKAGAKEIAKILDSDIIISGARITDIFSEKADDFA